MTALLINYTHLDHSSLDDCWPNDSVRDDIHQLAPICRDISMTFLSPLMGVDNFPFPKNLALSTLRVPVAEYDPNFGMHYEEITDLKAQELLKLSKKTNRLIVVGWSGGIDSTLVVAALLKCGTPEDYSRIIIATTKTGVWENSPFFFDCIVKNNLKVVEYDRFVSSLNTSNFSNYIYVNGYPNDQLLIGAGSSSEMAINDPRWLEIPWQDSAKILEYLSAYWTTAGTAEWLLRKLSESVLSLNAPVKSCYDLVRWLSFNYVFLPAFSNDYGNMYANICRIPINQWTDCAYQWFTDPRYQQWGLKNFSNSEQLLGPDRDQWKWVAKKYIYDYDKNDFYLRYKTKMGSSGRRVVFGKNLNKTDPAKTWVAITPDHRFLTIENDLDELKQLLIESLSSGS
jgi:hypothetical protein